jgi:hypothetical protein
MALKDLEAFDGLNIITTELDEMEVAHLLRVRSNLGLICQDCGSARFVVKGFVPVEMEILTGEHLVMTSVEYEKTILNRVVKCAHCDCTDFVAITNPTEEKDGEARSSIRSRKTGSKYVSCCRSSESES